MSNKKKRRAYVPPNKDPMKEIIKLNKMLTKIDVDGNVNAAINKVNQVNNKIIESNTVSIANNLIEKNTLVKSFGNDDMTIERYTANSKVELSNKPLIVGYLSDYGGCGHIRMIYPMNMINSKLAMTGKINCTIFPTMLYQDNIVPHVRAFVFQRPIGDDQIYKINAYKKYQKDYQYKMIGELDDFVFDIPEYLPPYEDNKIKKLRSLYVNLSKMDEIIVSTENLKNELTNLGLTNKITVIQNTLPKFLYETDVKRYRVTEFKKTKIGFTGSNYHFSNKKQMKGDFSDEVIKFIKNNVDNYDFVFFGEAPFFIKEEADAGKIVVYPFTDPYEYANNLRKARLDFVFAPLNENVFNSCKSDLKYIESAAIGALFIGTKFVGKYTSPYQNTKLAITESTSEKQINDIILKYTSNLSLFNEIISEQYSDIENRWMDNPNNLMKYVFTYTNGIKGLSLEETHPQYYQFRKYLEK